MSYRNIIDVSGLQSNLLGCTQFGWRGGCGEEVEVACPRQRQSSGNPAIMMVQRRAVLTVVRNLIDPDVTKMRSLYKGNQI